MPALGQLVRSLPKYKPFFRSSQEPSARGASPSYTDHLPQSLSVHALHEPPLNLIAIPILENAIWKPLAPSPQLVAMAMTHNWLFLEFTIVVG